jgi:hypothetical protein
MPTSDPGHHVPQRAVGLPPAQCLAQLLRHPPAARPGAGSNQLTGEPDVGVRDRTASISRKRLPPGTIGKQEVERKCRVCPARNRRQIALCTLTERIRRTCGASRGRLEFRPRPGVSDRAVPRPDTGHSHVRTMDADAKGRDTSNVRLRRQPDNSSRRRVTLWDL